MLSCEEKLKRLAREAVEDVAKEYEKILRFKIDSHVEVDVAHSLYFHTRKRIEGLKGFKRIKENLFKILLSELPSFKRKKKTERLDFCICNPKPKKDKIATVVAFEIKVRYDGFRKKRFKECIREDLKKLKKEKEKCNADCYLIFVHGRKYDNNFEDKVNEFKEGFKELTKELKIRKGVTLCYIHSRGVKWFS